MSVVRYRDRADNKLMARSERNSVHLSKFDCKPVDIFNLTAINFSLYPRMDGLSSVHFIDKLRHEMTVPWKPGVADPHLLGPPVYTSNSSR